MVTQYMQSQYFSGSNVLFPSCASAPPNAHIISYSDMNYFVAPGVKLTMGVRSKLGTNVRIVGTGTFELGDYCKVHDDCFINLGDGGSIKFGHNCWIGERSVIDGTGGIIAGNNIGIGIGSQLYSHIAHGDVIEGCNFKSEKTMILEDDVWFVGQCLVSPIHAASKSIAMLGSVVTKDMEHNRCYGGNPAKDITDKIGVPWCDRSIDVKLRMLHEKVQEFSMVKGAELARLIFPCVELPPKHLRDQNITYVAVNCRRYTKNSSYAEQEFLSWLTSYRGRFTPEEE